MGVCVASPGARRGGPRSRVRTGRRRDGVVASAVTPRLEARTARSASEAPPVAGLVRRRRRRERRRHSSTLGKPAGSPPLKRVDHDELSLLVAIPRRRATVLVPGTRPDAATTAGMRTRGQLRSSVREDLLDRARVGHSRPISPRPRVWLGDEESPFGNQMVPISRRRSDVGRC